jgi:hypothetical protein
MSMRGVTQIAVISWVCGFITGATLAVVASIFV